MRTRDELFREAQRCIAARRQRAVMQAEAARRAAYAAHPALSEADDAHMRAGLALARLAARLGREHFDRDADDEWLNACKEADLLVLDDLGTEYITPLTISVLYELINTRMLTQRPTVYTTNITDQQVFETRYTEKVASRMLGNCKMFKFFGADQRLQ